MVESLIKRSEKAKHLADLKLQNDMQKEYITLLTESRTQIQCLIHDFKLHVQSFLSLCESGQYEELEKNLRELAQKQERIPPVIMTGNPTFDAVMSSKKEEAEENNIYCSFKIRVTENLDILNLDVCVLFGNALDNAIEACLRTDGHRFIGLNIEINSSRLLFIMKNTVGQVPEYDGKFLRTQKTESKEHGMGLRSMKRCCDLHGGEMQFEFDKDVFELRVSLPLLQN